MGGCGAPTGLFHAVERAGASRWASTVVVRAAGRSASPRRRCAASPARCARAGRRRAGRPASTQPRALAPNDARHRRRARPRAARGVGARAHPQPRHRRRRDQATGLTETVPEGTEDDARRGRYVVVVASTRTSATSRSSPHRHLNRRRAARLLGLRVPPAPGALTADGAPRRARFHFRSADQPQYPFAGAAEGLAAMERAEVNEGADPPSRGARCAGAHGSQLQRVAERRLPGDPGRRTRRLRAETTNPGSRGAARRPARQRPSAWPCGPRSGTPRRSGGRAPGRITGRVLGAEHAAVGRAEQVLEGVAGLLGLHCPAKQVERRSRRSSR